MHSYQKFTKQVFRIGLLDLLATIQGLVFLSLITKNLGAGDYGIFTQIRVVMSLAIAFTFFGLHEALIRFIPGEKDSQKIQEGVYSSVALIFGANLIIALFLIVFSGYMSAFLKFDKIFVKLLSLIIIFESLNTILLVAIRSIREIDKYFWIVASKLIFEISIVAAIIIIGYGLVGAISSLLFIRLVIFLILGFFTIKGIGLKFPDFSLTKAYLSFGLPTIVDGISYWMITSLDRFLIGFFLGILFVGYYVPAYSIGSLLVFFIFPISFMLSTLLPKFFDDNDLEQVKNYLMHSLKYFSLFMIPSVFGVSVLSRQLLVVFSTQDIADKAFFAVPFVALSIFFYGTTYFFAQILVLFKKTKVIASVWMTAAFLNLALNMIFIPLLGILGAAINTFIAYFSALFLMRHFAFKDLQFKIEWVFMAKALVASVFMSLFILWIKGPGILGLLLEIVLGVSVYLILMILFKGLDKKEFNFLKSLIHEEMAILGK